MDAESCWNCGSIRMSSGRQRNGIYYAECDNCSGSRCEAKTEAQAIKLHRQHNAEMRKKKGALYG